MSAGSIPQESQHITHEVPLLGPLCTAKSPLPYRTRGQRRGLTNCTSLRDDEMSGRRSSADPPPEFVRHWTEPAPPATANVRCRRRTSPYPLLRGELHHWLVRAPEKQPQLQPPWPSGARR